MKATWSGEDDILSWSWLPQNCKVPEDLKLFFSRDRIRNVEAMMNCTIKFWLTGKSNTLSKPQMAAFKHRKNHNFASVSDSFKHSINYRGKVMPKNPIISWTPQFSAVPMGEGRRKGNNWRSRFPNAPHKKVTFLWIRGNRVPALVPQAPILQTRCWTQTKSVKQF